MKQVITLAILITLFFGITLGLRPYGTPSEARYIEVPRQMVVTGDWLTPRLNGVKYFEKPPLFYWLQAAQFELFGMGEFSGRFWTMALMLALCMVTYSTGTALYGRRSGLFAAIALATSMLGFALSRIVLLDVPVSLFLTGTLFAFLLAIREPAGQKRDALLAAMYLCAALAVLTKGMIGAVLPGLVIFVWLVLTGRWALLQNLRIWQGGLLFLIITVPWHVLAGQVTPEFLHFYFIHEHFERYLTPEAHRSQPWWFFALVVVTGWLPWTFFLPQAVREGLRGAWRNRRHDGSSLFLGLWVVLLFLFFSASHSKLIPYILPIFPPLALWLGRYAAMRWQTGMDAGMRRGVYLQLALLILMLGAVFLCWNLLGAKGLLTPALLPYVTAAIGWLVFTALALAVLLYKHRPARHICVLLLAYSIVQSLLMDIAAAQYPRDSVKPFAAFLAPILQAHPETEVAAFQHYYQDLPVYLNHNITVVDAEGEMEFGVSIEPRTRAWMIDEGTFWQRWNQPHHPMFMVIRKNTLAHLPMPDGSTLQPVAETANDVLVSNQDTHD